MSEHMRLALYGKDRASEDNLTLIEEEARRRGHEVAFTKSAVVDTNALLATRPHVVVTGLSSVPWLNTEINFGMQATQQHALWVIQADTHRSWARPWAKDRITAATVAVASPLEKQEATEFGFHDTYYFGGPPTWRDFFDIQSVPLERKSPDEKLILVPGDKDARITDHIAREVVAACRDVFGENWRLIFKTHPYEIPETVDEERRRAILENVTLLETPEKTNALLASVDCSITNPGAMATTIAAHIRKPTICLRDHVTNAHLRKIIGSEEWYPADQGACISADADNIREALLRACSEDGALELAEKQAAVYPPVSPGSRRPEARLLDFLEARV